MSTSSPARRSSQDASSIKSHASVQSYNTIFAMNNLSSSIRFLSRSKQRKRLSLISSDGIEHMQEIAHTAGTEHEHETDAELDADAAAGAASVMSSSFVSSSGDRDERMTRLPDVSFGNSTDSSQTSAASTITLVHQDHPLVSQSTTQQQPESRSASATTSLRAQFSFRLKRRPTTLHLRTKSTPVMGAASGKQSVPVSPTKSMHAHQTAKLEDADQEHTLKAAMGARPFAKRAETEISVLGRARSFVSRNLQRRRSTAVLPVDSPLLHMCIRANVFEPVPVMTTPTRLKPSKLFHSTPRIRKTHPPLPTSYAAEPAAAAASTSSPMMDQWQRELCRSLDAATYKVFNRSEFMSSANSVLRVVN